MRLLQNQIRDWLRKEKLRTKVWARFGSGEMDVEFVEPLENLPDPCQQDPHEHAIEGETVYMLRCAVAGLSAQQQKVFNYRFGEGLDVNEIAEKLGISCSSVKTHYSRAVHTLRRYMVRDDILS